MKLLSRNAHVVDDGRRRHRASRTAGCWSRTAASRRSAAAREPEADERVDLGGAVVTPGLVNTHHHLYQTLTRARAQQADLFTWLRELYPVWAGIDEESRVRGRAHRPRRARALGLHDGLRPPLRLPARARAA